MNIGSSISKSIKEGKWLNIHYQQENEVTNFWAAIKSINISNKVLTISMFNDKKNLNTIKDAHISYDKIISAEVIGFSDYDVPDSLIKFIEDNIQYLGWLEYDKYNNNVLNYYKECSVLDNDPFQKESFLVKGIDIHQLRKEKIYHLNEEQMSYVIDKIYRYDIKNKENKRYDFAISQASILINNKKYILCYYDIVFNPEEKWIKLKKELKFNKSFLVEGRKHSLFNYINMDVDEYIRDFKENYHQRTQLIRDHLKKGETFDDTPEIFLLEREYTVDLTKTFEEIENNYLNNTLTIPLKSFFGNITKRNNIRRKEPSIVIYDKRVNINQMRVIYNALKYPVTYVQGPPGTGKTQTILNVILSAFFEGKTMLVCSANNKPVDGIIENLKFMYKNEEVLFPFLRVGKFEEVIEATKKIKHLFEFKTNAVVKDYLINKIITKNNESHSELLRLLEIQEKRALLEDYVVSSQKLLDSLKDSETTVSTNFKDRVEQIKLELKDLPIISNEQLTDLFNPLTSSRELQQFLYFKSLSYINKLHEPKYKELIDICFIDDDATRATEFNKWCQNDKNMKLLNAVFPIVFSTNISSNRLGTPAFKFDLVIMDEAGQCNVAHSLIPICKAESLLLVGDPNQLKPVVLLEDHINDKLMEKFNVPDLYDYKKYSILDVMRSHDNISKYILIKYHYRCGKKIIQFSNDRYYQSALDLSYIQNEGELEFLNIKNTNVFEKNSAYEEAYGIIKYIQKNNLKDVYIVTPFVNQQNLINKLLKENNIEDIGCGTIHSLQGAEKDTIIFSTALSSKTAKATYAWIKNNFELLNVGATRAKNKLVISGDLDAINALSDKKDDLYQLINYAINDGKITVPPNDSIKLEIGKSNGSKNEDMFYETISHFCSTHKYFEVKRNVGFNVIFKDDPVLNKSKKEFDIVLYEVKWPTPPKPKIVIEINGGDHFGNRRREINDVEKIEVCKKKKIRHITIDNSFVKSYEYIRDIIIGSKNKKATQLTLDELMLFE